MYTVYKCNINSFDLNMLNKFILNSKNLISERLYFLQEGKILIKW